MQKEGSFRAYRNLPIGWLTHANHGRDSTERIFHWVVELFIYLALFSCLILIRGTALLTYPNIFVLFLIVHSLWWVINGNLHVYLLDSFKFIHNSGIESVLDYLNWVTVHLAKSEAVDAVLVYGSFCRSKFHNRSDLDLRVVRRKGVPGSLKLLFFAVFARVVSLRRGIPTDLQVVDSLRFLDIQMRKDEAPIVAYCRTGFILEKQGLTLSSVIENPSLVLKKTASI